MTKEARKDMLHFRCYILFQAISCAAPGSGTDATFVAASDPYRYQDVVNYTCDSDAAIVTRGSLSLRCEANGQWSDEPPTCREYQRFTSVYLLEVTGVVSMDVSRSSSLKSVDISNHKLSCETKGRKRSRERKLTVETNFNFLFQLSFVFLWGVCIQVSYNRPAVT